MRDPKRINNIMAIVTDIWKSVPDWRFGQLISNMISEIASKHEIMDIFFPEDDMWEKWLLEYKDKLNGKKSY